MHHCHLYTEALHFFGFADISALGDSVQTLAESGRCSPPLVLLLVDDLMAFTDWVEGAAALRVRVGVRIRKTDKGKGGSKKKEPINPALRHLCKH